MQKKLATVGITMGDPKGVGPEIIVKALAELPPELRHRVRIYGDRAVFEQAAKQAGSIFAPELFTATSHQQENIEVISDDTAARMTLGALDAALEDIKHKRITSLVTAPLNKERITSLLLDFTGHTEYLRKKAKVETSVMSFVGEEERKTFRLGLVTTHQPLAEVAGSITKEKVLSTLKICASALSDLFGIKESRLAVLGLNPHAGEGGHLGLEEKLQIEPAMNSAANESNISCFGPFPADAFFAKGKQLDYDMVVAMYHDQGLIPMKLLYPLRAVNVTLGLPFVRTSPGHGTAEDIAWKNKANAEGMHAAIEMADRLALNMPPVDKNSVPH